LGEGVVVSVVVGKTGVFRVSLVVVVVVVVVKGSLELVEVVVL